jgi:hypothetical protein
MKKLITTFFVLCAFVLIGQAQTGWNNYLVTAIDGTGNHVMSADTMYVGIVCRNGKYQAMLSTAADTLTAMGLPSTYNAGDSVTWKIVKGAAIGTTPRVRFINVKTGQYLYQGKKYGTSLMAYTASFNDNVPGSVKDFELKNMGTDSKGTYFYYIADGANQFFNDVSGKINIKSSATQGWKFVPRSGPQPKTTIVTPTVGLGTTAQTFSAGGSVTLNANITKGATDLLGTSLLYHGTTLIDTLSLDANGNASFTYNNLAYGTEKFTVVYTGDLAYGAADSTITLNVGPSANAKPTKVLLSMPTTAELYKDVPLNITVKTSTDDIVTQGNVIVYVNKTAKNIVAVDALGTGTVTFPNLLTGTDSIKAVYIGDKMAYLDSDTARVSIDITPSTSSMKPYPVYFDLADQPEIAKWNRILNLTATKTRPYSLTFRMDSLPGITITDTINNTFKVKYNALGTTYDKIDNCYNHADNITVALGSSRPTWVKFKTPWLNEGSYNVYISHRVNSDYGINMNSVTLDGKELYFPNKEMYGRWFRSWASSNTKRQWNAKQHSNSMGMNYIGSVRAENSGTHQLKITVNSENGTDVTMDMLEFIPVDMDSVKINDPAAIDMAQKYYPMFEWTGFANMGDSASLASVPTSYADYTNLAPAYQVVDQTNWGTKYNYTIDSVGIDTVMIGGSAYTANYVTVYRAEDKWTRVSEGYSDATNFNYTGQLPAGNYYYQTINFTDLGDGAWDYRIFVKDGYFSLPLTAVNNVKTSNIKAYGFNKMLTVKNIRAGAKIMVIDLMGRVISSSVSSSNIYTQKIVAPAVYIVKVISGSDNLVTKVLIE